MLLSMFAVNTVAFADEFKDNTTVSDEVTEAPVSDDEVDAVESVDKTDTSNSESEDTPVESPEPSQTVTDVVDLTHDSTADTVKDDTANSEDVVYTESDTSEDVIATPETAEPFIGIQAVTPDYGDKISAEVGDTVTLDALLNRDDVSVTYQWQKKQAFAADESYAIYPYEEDEPTWYDFVWEDSTEAKTLANSPDFVWQGCEMYYAIVDALDEIGADSSDVRVAWHTPNFVLDGYTITAANAEDGIVEVYASNGESTYTAHLNDDGKWEFGDEAAASQDTDWQDIEGATESTYTFEVTEDDLSANYRCHIVVTDEAYREENFKALEDLGNELTDEDKAMYGDAWRGEWECLFVGDDGTPLNPSTINEWLDKLTERNGLPHVTVHSLRHLCATLLIRTHADPKTVQTILRHANVSTTLNIYAKVFDSTQMEAIGRVQASLENMLKESCSSSAQV